MRKISKARSSRRAPALKDSDYDHEINLVDHVAEAETVTPHQLSLGSGADARRSIERTGPSLDESRVAGATANPTLSKYRTALSDAAKPPQPGPSSPRGDRPSSSPATVTRSRACSTGSSPKSEGSKCSSKRFSLRRRSKDTPAIPTVEVNGEEYLCPSLMHKSSVLCLTAGRADAFEPADACFCRSWPPSPGLG